MSPGRSITGGGSESTQPTPEPPAESPAACASQPRQALKPVSSQEQQPQQQRPQHHAAAATTGFTLKTTKAALIEWLRACCSQLGRPYKLDTSRNKGVYEEAVLQLAAELQPEDESGGRLGQAGLG